MCSEQTLPEQGFICVNASHHIPHGGKTMKTITISFLNLFFSIFSFSQDMAVTQTKETQAGITPQQALEMLIQGNQRFLESKQVQRDLAGQVKATAKGQYPYAVVLGCMDSRVPPETVFDQGIGDIFSCRIAGNIVDQDFIGSMEYACKVVGAKMILVLGHTDCGAIKGACDHVELGALTGLLEKIKPPIDMTSTDGERNSHNKVFVEGVSKNNVLLGVKTIRESPILKELIDKGELLVVGGMYDVESGKVKIYEE